MSLFDKNTRGKYDKRSLVDDIYKEQSDKEISELEKAAERVDAYERMKARRKRRCLVRTGAVTLILFVLTLGVVFLGYKLLFRINAVKIDGDCPYTADELADAAGIRYGGGLFSFSASRAERNAILSLPRIASLKVDRHIPDSVTLIVKYEEPVYYSGIYGKIYLFSETMRVLGEGTAEECETLTHLVLPPVAQSESGQVPVFRDPLYLDQILSVTKSVRASSLAARIDRIDLADYYNLSMICDGKYVMSFGDYSDVDAKLRIAAAVLEDEMFTHNNKARIDLSNLNKTSVVVDNKLTIIK